MLSINSFFVSSSVRTQVGAELITKKGETHEARLVFGRCGDVTRGQRRGSIRVARVYDASSWLNRGRGSAHLFIPSTINFFNPLRLAKAGKLEGGKMDTQKVVQVIEWWQAVAKERTALQTLRQYRAQCDKIAAELAGAARIASGVVLVTKRFVQPGSFKVFCELEINLSSISVWEKRKWRDVTAMSFSPTSPEGDEVEVRIEWRGEELFVLLRDPTDKEDVEEMRVDPNTLTADFR